MSTDTTFSAGTVITSGWLNSTNRLVNDIQDATSALKGAALSGYAGALDYAHGSVGDVLQTFRAYDYTTLVAAVSASNSLTVPSRILIAESFNITNTIVITGSNIFIEGVGSDMQHDVGATGANARTQLTWTGGAGGTMFQFSSPTGASAQKMNGGGMKNIFFNCNSLAGIGLQINSWNKGIFDSLHFNEPTIAGLDMGVVATLGEARDPQYNRFGLISGRAVISSGDIIRFGGDATANTSFNTFDQVDCQIKNGNGITFGNCDNIFIRQIRVSRAGGGTGLAMEFKGSNTAADQVARANIIEHFSSSAPTTCRGTSTYTFPSFDNSIIYLDSSNGTPLPTYETAATGIWSDTQGTFGGSGGFMASQAGIGDSASASVLARTRLGTTGTMHLVNGSGDHMQISDGANTNRWGININGANLRFLRSAGTGKYEVTPGALGNFADDAAAAAGGVAIGELYRTTSTIKVRIA
jgi:hypothetical protein